MKLVLDLCHPLAGYVASVIAVGNDEEASAVEYEIAERIETKLRDCPKGVRITIEPLG